MQIHEAPSNIAGIKSIIFDRKKFELSRDDIEDTCRFFSIGKLQYYEKDKDIRVSHQNPLIFIVTSRGQFVIKFYPMNRISRTIAEYALNRFLLTHHFPTPIMRAGHHGQPFLVINNRLAICFSYINGVPAWQCIKRRNIIRQINTRLLSLKKTLYMIEGHIPFPKHENLATTIATLKQNVRAVVPCSQKKTVETCLLESLREYKHCQPLFTRQWTHNHATFCNFLVYKKTVYFLDMEHIEEDYVFSDLINLIISGLFFRTPATTIKAIVSDYFAQHKMKPNRFPVLNTLLKVQLVKEYLMLIQLEKSLSPCAYPPDLMTAYRSYILADKETIITALRKMIDTSTFVI